MKFDRERWSSWLCRSAGVSPAGGLTVDGNIWRQEIGAAPEKVTEKDWPEAVDLTAGKERIVGKVEEALRVTVVRQIRRELRASVGPLSRELRRLKRIVSPLRKTVSGLEKLVAEQARRQQEKVAELKAPEEEVRRSRFSPALMRSLRARLGVTQGQLASLVDVSTAAVTAWESGRIAPRGRNRAALVAVRKLGRREVKRLLAERGATGSKKRAVKAGARKRKRRSRR
jgi:DNA-binding transcriptional regulator YiaG